MFGNDVNSTGGSALWAESFDFCTGWDPVPAVCGGVRLHNIFVSRVSFKTFYCYIYIVSILEAMWDLEKKSLIQTLKCNHCQHFGTFPSKRFHMYGLFSIAV